MKGLLVFVLRPADGSDCTNRGITSKVTKAILVGTGIPEIFESSSDMPVLVLVRRKFGRGEYLHAEPLEHPSNTCGPMAGGNYIHTCDGRFPSQYPIPVHDRFETQEQYDANFD